MKTKSKESTYTLWYMLKAIYGLAEAARMWVLFWRHKLLKIGFKNSLLTPCVFIRHNDLGTIVCGSYVDDIAEIYSNDVVEESFRKELAKEVKLGAIDEMPMYLGIDVVDHPDGVLLHNSTYMNIVQGKHPELLYWNKKRKATA